MVVSDDGGFMSTPPGKKRDEKSICTSPSVDDSYLCEGISFFGEVLLQRGVYGVTKKRASL
jgi:hypothetical protein